MRVLLRLQLLGGPELPPADLAGQEGWRFGPDELKLTATSRTPLHGSVGSPGPPLVPRGRGGESVEGARGASGNAFVPLPRPPIPRSPCSADQGFPGPHRGRQAFETAGAKIIAAGYPFGEYDVLVAYEASVDTVAAGLAQAIAAGGSVKSAQTTRMLTGPEWVESLRKAQGVSAQYRPAR